MRRFAELQRFCFSNPNKIRLLVMSRKDAYYFSHDANSQDDPKCMQLIDQLQMEGYGIFWALIEKLRSEKEYKLPLSVITSFSRRWQTTPEKNKNRHFTIWTFYC